MADQRIQDLDAALESSDGNKMLESTAARVGNLYISLLGQETDNPASLIPNEEIDIAMLFVKQYQTQLDKASPHEKNYATELLDNMVILLPSEFTRRFRHSFLPEDKLFNGEIMPSLVSLCGLFDKRDRAPPDNKTSVRTDTLLTLVSNNAPTQNYFGAVLQALKKIIRTLVSKNFFLGYLNAILGRNQVNTHMNMLDPDRALRSGDFKDYATFQLLLNKYCFEINYLFKKHLKEKIHPYTKKGSEQESTALMLADFPEDDINDALRALAV